MITETFLNSCFSIILNDNAKIRKDKSLYRDIGDVLVFYEDKRKIDIPMTVQTKFDCLKKICEFKLQDKTNRNIIDSISCGGRFSSLEDFLRTKMSEEIKDETMHDNIRQLRLRKKVNGLFQNYDQLTDFIDSLGNGSFESIDDLVLDYEVIIKKLYSTMMQENRGVAIEASASLDLLKDDYQSVQEMVIKKYQKVNTTSTGYNILDTQVFNGGFEASRIYIFGGASGSGKSTILTNFILNSATTIQPLQFNKKNGDINTKNVYVYITLENTIEESFMRMYQALFNLSQPQMINEITNGVDLKQRFINELNKTNSTIIMKYFPSMSISSLDIMAVLDDVISEYGKGCIKGLYIDYLDLLRTDTKYDLYRIELGHITLSLKTIAVEYNIPVITVTQLGRAAYTVKSADELNLNLIAESIKKVEHADFVSLQSKDKFDDSKIHLKVGKNRSGKSEVAIEFKVNFQTYKFISGVKVSNEQRPSVVTNNGTSENSFDSFKGLLQS